jgi:hypothetical protein
MAEQQEPRPVFRCSVCGGDLQWDRPSGVCSELCLRRGQDTPPAPTWQGDLFAPMLGESAAQQRALFTTDPAPAPDKPRRDLPGQTFLC